MKREETRDLRRLGTSELFVSPLGLGCLQFSRGKGLSGFMWPETDPAVIEGIVRASIDNGVNWFDTAELYGWGESERTLARALKVLDIPRDDVILATKWWPLFRTAGSISRTIGKRLACLDAEHVDLYQIHNPFSFSSVGSQMREMAGLMEKGQIRHVGVSNFSAELMRKAHMDLSRCGIALVSNQVSYSLLNREIEMNGVLDTASDLGVTIIAYSPLARGLLTGKFHERPELMNKRNYFRRFYGSLNRSNLERSRPVVDALKCLGGKYGATPSQIALNWLMNFRGKRIVVIPGASTVKQASDNAGSMSFRLSDDDLSFLDEVSSALMQ